jgi:hypothetical protein
MMPKRENSLPNYYYIWYDYQYYDNNHNDNDHGSNDATTTPRLPISNHHHDETTTSFFPLACSIVRTCFALSLAYYAHYTQSIDTPHNESTKGSHHRSKYVLGC